MDYGIYENGAIIARFVAPLTMRSNKPSFSSDTLSLKRATSSRGAQRWELETNVEPLTMDANDLFTHLVTKGNTETVTISAPQNYGVQLKRTSKSTPTAVGTKGGSSVTVTNNSGLIPKGTFIRFGNHSKIYMLTADLSNSGTMHIYPTLRVDVNSTFTHRDDVFMPCLYETDTIIGMVYTDGILMDNGKLKLIERL
jgi:hypothetical protein